MISTPSVPSSTPNRIGKSTESRNSSSISAKPNSATSTNVPSRISPILGSESRVIW